MDLKTPGCLNPCFNGRYSLRVKKKSGKLEPFDCLNPCFNGRYSLRNYYSYLISTMEKVLILVLMEDTH